MLISEKVSKAFHRPLAPGLGLSSPTRKGPSRPLNDGKTSTSGGKLFRPSFLPSFISFSPAHFLLVRSSYLSPADTIFVILKTKIDAGSSVKN